MESEPTPATPAEPGWRAFEVGFWVVLTLVNAIINSVTVWMDVSQLDLGFAAWEPAVWEWSSGLAMLALVPGLVWFTRRFPLDWDGWRRQLPWYVLGSLVFSFLHVLGMVALRELAYGMQGSAVPSLRWMRASPVSSGSIEAIWSRFTM